MISDETREVLGALGLFLSWLLFVVLGVFLGRIMVMAILWWLLLGLGVVVEEIVARRRLCMQPRESPIPFLLGVASVILILCLFWFFAE